jgi:ABC-type multidrug transport system fused ATPase/permease subunit
MEKIFEQLFKLIDNSIVEQILKKVIISNDMTPEQVMFINLFIENDKKNDFLRIKYIYLSEFLINFGYFADKVEDRRIFKIIVSGFTIYNRRLFAKILRKYEKKSIINIEKKILNLFNTKTEDAINKNIELEHGEELINIRHVYIDSYKVIAVVYASYNNIIISFCDFVNEIIILFLRPFFFTTRYGMLRNSFNIIFVASYSIFVYFLLLKDIEGELKSGESGKYISDDIITFFNNLNIIVEKNKMKEELSNLLQNIIKVVSDPTFINEYQTSKLNKNYVNIIGRYKILETIISLVVNDAYLITLTESIESAMVSLSEKVYSFRQKLNMSNEIIDILKLNTYRISNPIVWNQDKKYDYLFVLNDVTVEYKENDKCIPVFVNVNLSFELNGIHFIYGNSGSGKTTLVNTLMKKLKIKNGSIKFLNEYENYTYFSIRNYITFLTSESILFSKSIYYNITFGMNEEVLKEKKDEISQEIIKYMNILNMKEFITDIKSKNSKKLSKGQTQRVAIIRLFINIIFDNVKILFLDEFTSNIDNDMEIIIFTELLQLHSRHSLTIFMISHNMYNIKYSDFNYKFNVEQQSISKFITNKDDVLCIK